MATQLRPRLTAEPRTGVHKKSALRELRASGQIPALVYGHGDPQPIRLSERTVRDYFRHHSAGAILDLEVQGQATPALIRELDRHPVTGRILHLGLQRVDMLETLKTTVPLVFHGEDELIRDGLVLERQVSDLEVQGRADRIPESILVELKDVEVGHAVRISDLELPAGIEATHDPDSVIARVTLPKVAPEVEAALEAEEAAHEAARAETEEEKEEEPEEEAAAAAE